MLIEKFTPTIGCASKFWSGVDGFGLLRFEEIITSQLFWTLQGRLLVVAEASTCTCIGANGQHGFKWFFPFCMMVGPDHPSDHRQEHTMGHKISSVRTRKQGLRIFFRCCVDGAHFVVFLENPLRSLFLARRTIQKWSFFLRFSVAHMISWFTVQCLLNS